ncbi:MAG: hypothetical protein R3275_08930 [Saprospiraceae bacterium]|nr:hypothetical protein [Saprospiraceae bacterium]
MKNLLFTLLLLGGTSCIAQTSTGMNEGMAMGILEEWCQENFSSCFSWEFIDIEYVSGILRISSNKYIVKGTNRNSAMGNRGYNQDVVSREFKATITDLGGGRYSVKFKKQQIYDLFGESWATCTRTINL